MGTFYRHDFSAVRVHVGTQASRLGALAFAIGNDLYFAPGMYQPNTLTGRRLLGHELAHVVQQREGRVRPAPGAATGISLIQDHGLEAEADRLGQLAASGAVSPVAGLPPGQHGSGSVGVRSSAGASPIVQLKHGARWTQGQKDTRKREMEEEHELLSKQRANLVEISPYDEVYFQAYLREWKRPATVYRGSGGGHVNENALAAYVRADIRPKPGEPEISFYGIVAHTHSNTSPGGMVSTTTDKASAVEWATDDHAYGLVWEIQLADYIDMNHVLTQRNFRNRYEGQKEYLIPRAVRAAEIKAVSLYRRNGVFVEQKTFR